MSWETVMGLEVHLQLATQSKIFSGSATAFGAAPNEQADAVDLGMPGMLPVLNEEAVRYAVKFGLGIGARIGERSVFDRKNYFYPDLPKGYQVSQFFAPIVCEGVFEVPLEDGTLFPIRITRAHLEEDAGKSVHDAFSRETGIDLNRAGTPLLEIVTEPDFRSAEQAVASLQGVLRRTANAQAEAEASGKTGIGCRELRLVQSVDDLLAPKVMEGAEVTWLE